MPTTKAWFDFKNYFSEPYIDRYQMKELFIVTLGVEKGRT
jgi:hypothetical protein